MGRDFQNGHALSLVNLWLRNEPPLESRTLCMKLKDRFRVETGRWIWLDKSS